MNVKISELSEVNELYPGCCFPIVQNGETKKVTFETLGEMLGIENNSIDSITTSVVTGEDGTKKHIITISLTDGTSTTFEVSDGKKPVRGVDYWTAEDVAAIRAQCEVMARKDLDDVLISGEAEGENITLTDSAKYYAKVSPKGKSTQVSKNKLNLNTVSGSLNDKDPTVVDGVINVKGSNNTEYNFKSSYKNGYVNIYNTDKWKDETRYFLSCKIEVVSNQKNLNTNYFAVFLFGQVQLNISYNSVTGRYEGYCNTGTGVTEKDTYLEFRLDGFELNISEIMLATEETYEYEGYGAIPSPEHPIKIVSVTSPVTVKSSIDNQESIVTIPLSREMRSLPNGIYDRIYKLNGKWYDEQNVAKIVFTGADSEGWGIEGTNNFYSKIIENAKASQLVLSNYQTSSVTTITQNENCFISSSKMFNFQTIKVTHTVADFKTWLSTHNTEVIYELAEPIINEITDADTIMALENLRTYKGTTNITADAPISVEYKKDLEILINNLQAQTLANEEV